MSTCKSNSKEDDVLSCTDSDSNSFSGFSKTDSSPENSPRRTSLRSVVTKVKDKGASRDNNNNGGAHGQSQNDGNLVNLDDLSAENVEKLRNILGIKPNTSSRNTRNANILLSDDDSCSRDSQREFDFDESDVFQNREKSFSKNLKDSLFDNDSLVNDDDDDFWPQAKLKAPDRGEPISSSLAKLINESCTQPCNVNDTISNYKVPANCEFMSAPRVNEEIWGELARNRRVQTTDKLLRDTQNLVTAGMLPILSLAKVIKPFINQVPQVKNLIADSLTLFGQVQFNLSVRRRYILRPYLKQKYSGICNINTPISTFLFGDDVNKELKKCETSVNVGKYSNKSNSLGPTRGRRGGKWKNRNNPYNYNTRGGYGSSKQGQSNSYG